jgi:hypothetical protein
MIPLTVQPTHPIKLRRDDESNDYTDDEKCGNESNYNQMELDRFEAGPEKRSNGNEDYKSNYHCNPMQWAQQIMSDYDSSASSSAICYITQVWQVRVRVRRHCCLLHVHRKGSIY